ncbi:MAG: glycosyltransferase family 4 protein [Bacteroidia bacterium]|nr:glycosyltransferase family 4 protein [Bacteroidia bacterium]
MRVALLTDGIWPYVLGGMQKHSYYICKYLAQNGVEVHLFHFNQSQYDIRQLEFFTDEEKKFIRSRVLEFPKSPGFPGHYLYDSYRYSKQIYNSIKGELNTFDFIYSKGFSAWYLIEQKKKGRIKCPPIGVKFHGYEMFQTSPDLKTKLQHMVLLRRPVKWISQQADVVFSYGGKITDLIESIGVKRKNIIELPSGLEAGSAADEISETHVPPRFLFLGRYERRKGIEELNQALKGLFAEKEVPAFEMHFVGPIPEDKKITHPQVVYHGEIRDKKKLTHTLRSCDVLLCPSWSEGFPNVLLEAMGNGLTVLATDVGAVSVLVNSSNGLLMANADSHTIKEAIKTFLSLDQQHLLSMKKNALHTISNRFVWEKLIPVIISKLQAIKAN